MIWLSGDWLLLELSSYQPYENCDGNVLTIQPDPSFSISAVNLTRRVSAVIFPQHSVSDIGPPAQMFICQWTVLQARAMFLSDVSSPERWRNLVLIALVNSPLIDSDRTVHAAIARPMVASFFRLAARMQRRMISSGSNVCASATLVSGKQFCITAGSTASGGVHRRVSYVRAHCLGRHAPLASTLRILSSMAAFPYRQCSATSYYGNKSGCSA